MGKKVEKRAWGVRSIIFIFTSSIGILLLSPFAGAHPLDLGLLDIQVSENKIDFNFSTEVAALSVISGIDSDRLTESAIPGERNLAFAALLGAARVTRDEAPPCTWGDPRLLRAGQKAILIVSAECPGGTKSWHLDLPLFRHAPGTFEIVAHVASGSVRSEMTANAQNPRLAFGPTIDRSAIQFVRMGIAHIGALPSEWTGENGWHFPDGIDHILFVFALVLGGGGFIGILKTVTGFTVGHSITLALATLGWVRVPARLVESAIALSIAVVAAESFAGKRGEGRWKIALGFGLIHGLGFASALADLHLTESALGKALFGFNAGVEVGQAIIVLALFPIVSALAEWKYTRRMAVPACAAGVFGMGVYWFVQRAFGL